MQFNNITPIKSKDMYIIELRNFTIPVSDFNHDPIVIVRDKPRLIYYPVIGQF